MSPTSETVSQASQATLARVRWVVALLASVTAIGGLIELAMLRHWVGIQIVPWVVLAAVVIVGVVTARGGPRRLAQATAAVALLAAGFGVLRHVAANHALGPLLPQYAQTWDSMGPLQQWWLAATGSIGSAPALAPGILGLAGALLIVAVLGRD